MIEKKLLELTASTLAQADEILTMSAEEYRKKYGTDSERVEKAKIEKVQGLIGNLNFFIRELREGEEKTDGE